MIVTVIAALRRPVVAKRKRRQAHASFGMEAFATSHYLARAIPALGHDVRLIPPAYVKPYVKRQKNDAADAVAICEAATRPNMRFVPIKTEERLGRVSKTGNGYLRRLLVVGATSVSRRAGTTDTRTGA